jgi:oligopeptidase A
MSDPSDTADTNPLLSIEFAIPFDRLRPEHVEPAAKALLADARAQLQRIAALEGPRTYENTLGALDLATERLETAMTVVSHLESVVSTPQLRSAYNAVQPEVSAFYASIPLDADLWRALKAYAETDQAKQLTGTRRRYLEKTLDSFKRHGADLDEAGKRRLEEITRELSERTTKYAQNVVDATAGFELYVEDESKLKGLPDSAIQAARASAESKGKPGWRFTLQAPSMVPLLTYLADAAIRERVYRAYNARATAGTIDNRPLLDRILELRKEQAQLLGFKDFADFVLHDRMAKEGARARAFVEDLTEKTKVAFARENEALTAFRKKIEGDEANAIEPWDVAFYAEKERRALYDFDEEELRPYFAVDRVLEGLFRTAERLYGIRIEPTSALPTWNPAVRAFDIFDEDGTWLGSFYADLFPREEKRGGAWMNGLITGLAKDGEYKPHLGLISANVTPPIGDKPALLTHDEVETLFHEFGHLLHHSLSRVDVRTLAGTNVAWDFVELPSQIMENWCWERPALDLFARHHETGQAIPDELFQKMQRARKYRSANAMMRQLGFAAVDLALHVDYAPERDGDVVAYSRALMQRYAPVKYPDDYAFIASFNHLFASEVGYAAGYYSYKWAEVLDADAFTRFAKEGIFSRTVGEDFRRKLLERGNGADPMDLYKDFMGREPSLDPLLSRLGLLEKLGPRSVFQNPDAVREHLQLPAVVFYSFVGDSSERYQRTLETIIERIVGAKNVRGRTTRPSSQGKYTAYRFEVFHENFDDVEAIYREVGALPGTRFVL